MRRYGGDIIDSANALSGANAEQPRIVLQWDINAHSQSKAEAGCFEYGQWTKLRNFVNKRCEIVNKCGNTVSVGLLSNFQ